MIIPSRSDPILDPADHVSLASIDLAAFCADVRSLAIAAHRAFTFPVDDDGARAAQHSETLGLAMARLQDQITQLRRGHPARLARLHEWLDNLGRLLAARGKL